MFISDQRASPVDALAHPTGPVKANRRTHPSHRAVGGSSALCNAASNSGCSQRNPASVSRAGMTRRLPSTSAAALPMVRRPEPGAEQWQQRCQDSAVPRQD